MEIVAWWAFLVVVWIATLNVFSVQEVVVAAVLAVPCAFAARAGRRASAVRWRVDPRWARWLLALPAAVAHDLVTVLTRPERDDTFQTMKLPEEHDGERRTAREAVTTVVFSATPGSVVVEARDDELLVHAVPAGTTRLERELRR